MPLSYHTSEDNDFMQIAELTSECKMLEDIERLALMPNRRETRGSRSTNDLREFLSGASSAGITEDIDSMAQNDESLPGASRRNAEFPTIRQSPSMCGGR